MNSTNKSTGRGSKSTASTTAVATTNTKAYDALNMVRERIKAIKIISDAPPRTNGIFKYNPTASSPIRIADITNVAELLNILGFVLEKEKMYNDAATACGLKEYPVFTWCGYNGADWAHDIKVRIAIINHHNNLSQLETAERELSGFLSQDDKLSMLLGKLGNLLG
jgi:hypothetical protein